MLTCYLAGPITGLTFGEATDWRKYAQKELEDMGVEALSPMRGKDFLLRRVGRATLGQTYEEFPLSSQRGIVARDRFDVRRCDVVLMNLLYADKVSIGSMVEIGWADAFGKLLIVVMQPPPRSLSSGESGEFNPHDHAFVKQLAAYVVPTLDEALDIIEALAKTKGGD